MARPKPFEIHEDDAKAFASSNKDRKRIVEKYFGEYSMDNWRAIYGFVKRQGYITNPRVHRKFKIVKS